MINIVMRSSDPLRTSDMSNNRSPVYNANRLSELTSQNLSRKLYEQSGNPNNQNTSRNGYTPPQVNRPNAPQSGYASPQANRPNTPQSGYASPQANRPNTPQSGYASPQANRPNAPQSGYTSPQANRPNTSQVPIQNNIVNERRRPPLPPPQKILKKGEKYSLTKNHPGVKSLRVGIGWDFASLNHYDVDIEAFLLNDSEKVPDDSWIVFYGQLQSPDRAITHRGDSSSGVDLGADCEQIDVELGSLSTDITKIAFVVTINEAKQHGYNFSGMKNAYIRFSDKNTGKELIRYELTDYYREVVSMVVGELYFRNNEWRFNPVGMGTSDDLEGLCNKYGIEVK